MQVRGVFPVGLGRAAADQETCDQDGGTRSVDPLKFHPLIIRQSGYKLKRDPPDGRRFDFTRRADYGPSLPRFFCIASRLELVENPLGPVERRKYEEVG